MSIRPARRVLLPLVLWLVAVGAAYAQESKAVSYTFVSPNTREGLTLGEAVKGLHSREEFLLINHIRTLSRCLRLKPLAVRKTIGSRADGPSTPRSSAPTRTSRRCATRTRGWAGGRGKGRPLLQAARERR